MLDIRIFRSGRKGIRVDLFVSISILMKKLENQRSAINKWVLFR